MKLKKLIATILALLSAASIAVGISGCKDEISLPPMTETAPVIATYKEMDYYYPTQDEYYHYTKYTNFVEYYNGEFRQVCTEKFYLINDAFVEPEEQRWFHIGSDVSVLVEKDSDTENGPVNPVINCLVYVCDNDIGIYRIKGSNAPATVEFDAYFIPVEEGTQDDELSLKFGKLNKENYYSYYINMYKGNICIGTVYFHTEVSISYEWFEGFFTRHIVYGG